MKHKRFGTGFARKVLACLVSAAMVVAFAPTVAWGDDPIDLGKQMEVASSPDSADRVEIADDGTGSGGGSGDYGYDDWEPAPTLSQVGDTINNFSMPSGTATNGSGSNIALTGSIRLISNVPGVDDKGNPTSGSVCLFELDFAYNYSNPSASTITVTIPSTVKVGGKSYGVAALGAADADPSAAANLLFLKAFTGQLAQTLNVLNIPLTVTQIEQESFTNCTKLQQLKMLVNKVLDIRSNAFAGLPNLSSVEATAAPMQASASDEPQTVSVTLGAGAFAKAYALAMFAVKAAAGSNGIADIEVTIGDQCFEGCKSLFSADFQAAIQSIGRSAFQGCTDLEKLVGVIQSSGMGTLSTRSLRPLDSAAATTDPSFPTKISFGAFEGCVSLKTVELSGGMGEVEESAFQGCSSLSEVPACSGGIGDFAFAGCTSLPAVISCSGPIGSYAFANCTGLTATPAGATSIGDYAFSGCTALRSASACSGPLGVCAFAGCAKLAAVPAGATAFGQGAFFGSGITSVTIAKGVRLGTGVFENCKKLASATVAKGAAELPASTFRGCSKLAKVTLGSSLGTIGAQALAGCAKLKSLTLPKGVKVLGSKALTGCSKLAKLTVKSTQLTKKGVTGALKGSSVAVVCVPKGKLKAYGKLFVKSVCGKKVTVEAIA